MTVRAFRFRHVWQTPAPPAEVYAVLADVASYPLWWPQVLAVARIDDRSGWAVCRSLVPFRLNLRLTAEREDPAAGVLRVQLDGDLAGWCEFRLNVAGSGTSVEFQQQVTVERASLRRATVLMGPGLRANHAWMMRGCRNGLDRHLATA
ncbi:MAG: polyketide cyclase [Actinomycetota bacterium]|nr:polyketide cyclase [Actinomycetota bacterium]